MLLKSFFFIKALIYHEDFQSIGKNIQTISFEKVISDLKAGLLPNCQETSKLSKSCLEGVHLLMIHYRLEKDMAKNGQEYKTEKAPQGQENCNFSFLTYILPFYIIFLIYKM